MARLRGVAEEALALLPALRLLLLSTAPLCLVLRHERRASDDRLDDQRIALCVSVTLASAAAAISSV